MRFRTALLVFVVTAAVGCGNGFEGEESVPLDKVPAPVMETAKKALPGVTFVKAYKGKVDNGKEGYEIQGKTREGKVREAEVAPDGTLYGVE